MKFAPIGVDFLYLSVHFGSPETTAKGNAKRFHAFLIAILGKDESRQTKNSI